MSKPKVVTDHDLDGVSIYIDHVDQKLKAKRVESTGANTVAEIPAKPLTKNDMCIGIDAQGKLFKYPKPTGRNVTVAINDDTDSIGGVKRGTREETIIPLAVFAQPSTTVPLGVDKVRITLHLNSIGAELLKLQEKNTRAKIHYDTVPEGVAFDLSLSDIAIVTLKCRNLFERRDLVATMIADGDEDETDNRFVYKVTPLGDSSDFNFGSCGEPETNLAPAIVLHGTDLDMYQLNPFQLDVEPFSARGMNINMFEVDSLQGVTVNISALNIQVAADKILKSTRVLAAKKLTSNTFEVIYTGLPSALSVSGFSYDNRTGDLTFTEDYTSAVIYVQKNVGCPWVAYFLTACVKKVVTQNTTILRPEVTGVDPSEIRYETVAGQSLELFNTPTRDSLHTIAYFANGERTGFPAGYMTSENRTMNYGYPSFSQENVTVIQGAIIELSGQPKTFTVKKAYFSTEDGSQYAVNIPLQQGVVSVTQDADTAAYTVEVTNTTEELELQGSLVSIGINRDTTLKPASASI